MIRIAFAAAVLALGVQWIVLAQLRDDPTLTHPVIDSATYHRQATAIAEGHAPGGEAFFQPPLYPYALSAVYRITGSDPFAARVAQTILGAIAVGLIVLLGAALYGRTVGIVAGVLAALHGPLIFFHARLLPAGLATTLDLLGLLLLVRALRTGRLVDWTAAGIVFGLAGVTVANALAIPVAIAAVAVLVAIRARSARPLGLALMLTVGAAITVAPVTWHNLRESGEPVLVSTNSGINLWIGNNPEMDRTIAIRPGYGWTELQREAVVAGARTPVAMDRWFRERVAGWARTDPGAFLAGLVRKTGRLLSAREIPRNLDIDRHAARSPVLSALTWHRGGFALPGSLLIPLAAWGAFLASRRVSVGRTPAGPTPGRRVSGQLAVVAFLIVYGATVVLFFPTARYRLPLAPAVCVLAAAGMVDLAQARRRPAIRAAIAAMLVVLSVLASRFVPLRQDATEYQADVLRLVALERLADGDTDDAVHWLERSMIVLPGSPDTHNYLAAIRIREGRFEEGLAEADAAIAADPHHAEAHLHRASALTELDRVGEAERAAEAAVRASSSLAPAWALLARLAERRADVASARDFAERAVALDPGDASSLSFVASLIASDESPEAAELERALALARMATEIERTSRPEQHARSETLEVLARVLARLGEPERAARVLDRAIAFERDPSLRAGLEGRRSALALPEESGAAPPDDATLEPALPE